MVRWSSISLASFRASSTGCTEDRKVRPKRPSTRPPILRSMSRKTLTVGSRDGLSFGSAAALEARPGDCPGGGNYSGEARRASRTTPAGPVDEELRDARSREAETQTPQRDRLQPP